MKERIGVSDQARYLLHAAGVQAKRLGQASATAAHVLLSVWKQPPSMAGYILDDLGIDVDELRRVVEAVLRESGAPPLPSEGVAAINERAQGNAERLNCPIVDTEHVLLAALQLAGAAVRVAFERLRVPLEVALARAEAIAEDVALGRVLPKLEPRSEKES